jgi:hypothetical protein
MFGRGRYQRVQLGIPDASAVELIGNKDADVADSVTMSAEGNGADNVVIKHGHQATIRHGSLW